MNLCVDSLKTVSFNSNNYSRGYSSAVSFQGSQRAVKQVAGSTLATCLAGYAGINFHKDNTKDVALKQCVAKAYGTNFEAYKQSIIEYLKTNNYAKYDREGENIISDLAETRCKQNIDFELEMYLSRIMNEMEYKEIDILEKDIDLSAKNKLCNKIERETGNIVTSVIKLLQNKNDNPEVISIKNEIEKKYGKQFLYLNNDIEFAKALRNVLELLEKNNIPITKVNNIIASDCVDFVGICMPTDNGNTLIISPHNWQVEDLEHAILHEILHTLQPNNIEFKLQEIPAELKETADNVSEYAKDNHAHEVHCELYVKKLKEGLNQDEEKLFNTLGGTFL